MTNDEIAWDVDGRQASGQRFRTLTDEQQQSHQSLRAQMGGNPLPYPEFAGPYQEFIGALFGGSEELTAQWGGIGDGQVLMAAGNAQAEAANGGEG
ncbi:hypothetical protein [Streptosporangium roseum]|uniref:hypothetical protein n=1 Tax=Streptosporangium roseum TaxID=2001 RepID=UPI0004CCB152|nr:hypothetical protein [Streptosporangium roseum]